MIFHSSLCQRRQGYLCNIWYRVKNVFTCKNRAKLFLKCFLMKFWKCLHKWRQCNNFDVTFESSLHQRRQGYLCDIWWRVTNLFTCTTRAKLFLKCFLMKFWKCLHKWRQCNNYDVTFESSLHQRRQVFFALFDTGLNIYSPARIGLSCFWKLFDEILKMSSQVKTVWQLWCDIWVKSSPAKTGLFMLYLI